MFALTINDLTFNYDNELVLRDVNLEIPENEFAVVIGPNGGGKSTLLKLILGLLPCDRGNIEIYGKPAKDAYIHLGYVPQDTEHLKNFPVTALDTVLMGLYNFEGTNSDKVLKAQQILAKFGMATYGNKRLNELSTGQRQRVLIARAMVNMPKVILLDEALSGVDPEGQRFVLDMLKEYVSYGTVIFVSHNLEMIPQYATSIICVNRTLYYHQGNDLDTAVRHLNGNTMILVAHECKCEGNH